MIFGGRLRLDFRLILLVTHTKNLMHVFTFYESFEYLTYTIIEAEKKNELMGSN